MMTLATRRRRRRRRPPQQYEAVRNLLTTPFVYSLALPLLMLDIWVSLYQLLCFPFYGIERVRRRPYFVIDRHTLTYLTAVEKANCFYCSYAAGVLAFVREVAARTEQYWCPIKHARPIAVPHRRYASFFDYGDGPAYHRGLPRMRRALRAKGSASARRRPRKIPSLGRLFPARLIADRRVPSRA
jgi:hypothetical protein